MGNNTTLGLTALSGFLQGRSNIKKREEDSENKKLQSQMIKMQIEGLKIKQKESDIKNNLINHFLSQNTANEQTPAKQPSSDTTPMGDRLLDAMSGDMSYYTGEEQQPQTQPQAMPQQSKGFGNMGMPQAVMLDEASGINFPEIVKFQETQRANQAREGISQGGLQLRQGAKNYIDTTDENGNPIKIEVDVFGKPTGKAFNVPVKAETRRYMEGGTTYEQDINPFTGKQAFPGQGQGQGGRVVTEQKPISGPAPFAAAEQAITELSQVRDMIMPNGKVDDDTYKILAQMKTRLPWSTGREAYGLMYSTISTKLRAESGAAITEPEVADMAKRLVPDVLDKKSQIISKLNRMDRFLRGYVELMDPNKNYRGKDVETFKGQDGREFVWVPGSKVLTKDLAIKLLEEAGGDKAKAEALAKERGFEF